MAYLSKRRECEQVHGGNVQENTKISGERERERTDRQRQRDGQPSSQTQNEYTSRRKRQIHMINDTSPMDSK